MAVIASAKMWSMILQMVLLVQYHQAEAIKVKREPYSVQETNQEFSSGGGDLGGYSSWSDGFSSDSGGGHFIKGRGGFGGDFGGGSGGFYSSHLGLFSGFGMGDSSSGSYDGLKAFGKQISEGPQFFSSGGKSFNALTDDETSSKIHALIEESKIKLKLAAEKVAQMRKEYGYGTFGYHGYEYPKFGPIDLGTHHGVDLGTTLDSKSIKDSHGKLKLPVQTVLITKTLGVPIPEPFPVKQEVAVPAPYPVPVPSHYSGGESYPSSYSSDYSGDSGKSSYSNGGLSLSKVVQYHENLPKSTEKHYASASTNYVRYLPRPAYRTSYSSSQYSSAPKQSVYEF